MRHSDNWIYALRGTILLVNTQILTLFDSSIRCHDRFFDPALLAAIVGTPLILFLILIILILIILHRRRRDASSSTRASGSRASCNADDDDGEEEDGDGVNRGVDEEDDDDEDDDDNAGEELVAKGQKRIPLNNIEIKITGESVGLQEFY